MKRCPVHISPRRHPSSAAKPFFSFPEMEGFEMDKKHSFRDARDSPRAYKHISRKKDAFTSSIHRPDPFRVSQHKRNRSLAEDRPAILIPERNEIRRDSLRDKSYIPRAGDFRLKKIDRGRRNECSSPMDARKTTLNETYDKKWHTRQKSDSGTRDRPEIAINISESIPMENCRGSRAADNRWRNGKDELIRRREKSRSPREERSEVTKNGKLFSNFPEMKAENGQRFDTWSLACALAYDYLNKRYAVQSNGGPAQTFVGHPVKKAVQQQEPGKLLQRVHGPATKGETSQALCIEERNREALREVQGLGREDENFRAFCMKWHREELM